MRIIWPVTFLALWLVLPGAPAWSDAAGDEARLAGIIQGAHRSEFNRNRDGARHPFETLKFFGLKPDMKVAEIWPGGAGYYAEIIAPFVAGAGQYTTVVVSLSSQEPRIRRSNIRLFSKFVSDRKLYGFPRAADISSLENRMAPDGSLDLVLSFRNLHNWIGDSYQDFILEGIYKSLRPGGYFGLVDHRLDGSVNEKKLYFDGYMTTDYAVRLVTKAGFRLVASSEANANPRDTSDHPKGVWTLPPTLALGKENSDIYIRIGESDRMTLLFQKPGGQPE